ncbi:hypothetical protein ACFLWC_04170 [Chloroflexota bacterium]
MPKKPSKFSRSVFVNCPFDAQYRPLLWSLLFTILECDLEPRIASESSDSGTARIDKIKSLIKSCRYSIHDISRIEPVGANKLPRFNMPFELGLDLGCRQFGQKQLKSKKCLVLEKSRYRYQKVLSDIAGCDIKAHREDAKALITQTRNWICENISTGVIAGSMIWERYNIFISLVEEALINSGCTKREIRSMPVPEYLSFVKPWIKANPS